MCNHLPLLFCLCSALTHFAAPTGDDIHWSPQFGPPGVTELAVGMHVATDGQIMVSQVCAPETNCPIQLWDGRSWRSIGILQGGLGYALAITKQNNTWYV